MPLLHEQRGEREVAEQLYLECDAIYAKVYGLDHSDDRRCAKSPQLRLACRDMTDAAEQHLNCAQPATLCI